MAKQGFSADNYNLKPDEAGMAAQINMAVEAMADGFQLREDLPALKEGGVAVVQAILEKYHSKDEVLAIFIKLAVANILDELAEKSQEVEKLKEHVAVLERQR